MQPEITKKLATMRAATKAIRGDFLCRPHIVLESRLLILKMLIFSKGLFQAGTWPFLYVSELSRLHTYIMDLFSSIVEAGVPRSARRSHESMLAVEGVTAPFVLLLILRMKLFVRVCLHASDVLVSVIFEAQGDHRARIDAVEHDIRFLTLRSDAFGDMAGASVRQWVERIRAEPRHVARRLMSSANERRMNDPSAWARAKGLTELNSIFTCEHCLQGAWAPENGAPTH